MPSETRSGPTIAQGRKTRRKEYSTPQKTRFFEAYDKESTFKSLPTISDENNIPTPTARRWLRLRNDIGTEAYQKTRRRSKVIGRKKIISKTTCQMLVDPVQNPVRDQQFEAQMEHFHIPGTTRTLQKALKENTKGARRYKQRYVKKRISKTNRDARVAFGKEHEGHTVYNFWQFVFFTDEAHLDPSSQTQGFILREQGTAEEECNIQERGEKTGVRLHVSGWVSWTAKCEKLTFYND